MNIMLQGAVDDGSQAGGSPVNPSEDSQRMGRSIDGAFYPKKERVIDRMGYEITKHALHFRGCDWSHVLSTRRDELTRNFVKNAAAATKEPEEHVQNVRFIVTADYLDAKCTIRHKTHTTMQQVQHCLAKYPWTDVKSLYVHKTEGRPKHAAQRHNSRHEKGHHQQHGATEQAKRLARELSEYGRANVGPEGVDFKNGKDMDEEPEATDALATRQQSNMFAVGFPS